MQNHLPRLEQENKQQDEEDEEHKNLHGKTSEQDVIPLLTGFVVAFRDADEGCAADLHDRADGVAGDEDGEDGFGGEER